MIRLLHFKRSVAIFALATLCLLSSSGNMAIAANSKGGITISPPFQELTVLPNQTSLAQEFTIQNNDEIPRSFTLSSIDMGALDDSGGVVFSGLAVDYRQKYGLSEWIRLERKTITVPARSSAAAKFEVINDDKLGPGGHYGAIIISPMGSLEPAVNQIELDPQAATLLFVRKVGGEKYKLDISGTNLTTAIWSLPRDVKINFKNSGNIHVVPRGLIVVRGPFGHEVARGAINSESSILLPEKNRGFVTKMLILKKFFLLPGKYKVEVNYRYDGNTEYSKSYYSFTFINLSLILSVLATVAAIFYLRRKLKAKYGNFERRITSKIWRFIKSIKNRNNKFAYLIKLLRRKKKKVIEIKPTSEPAVRYSDIKRTKRKIEVKTEKKAKKIQIK